MMRRIAPALFAWISCRVGGHVGDERHRRHAYLQSPDRCRQKRVDRLFATGSGPFTGVEQVFATTVTCSMAGATVTGVARSLCAGGALGAPTTISAGGWPVGIGKGASAMSGVAHRIITDQVGSVRLVVNTSTGVIAQRMDYDTFGNVILDTSPGD